MPVLQSLDSMMLASQRGDAWPFSPGDGLAEQLLALAEGIARQALGDVDTTELEQRPVAAYQYQWRDTSAGSLPTLPTVHADNVGALDALRDFAPALHDVAAWSAAARAGTTYAAQRAVSEAPLAAATPRDALICGWASGSRIPLLGLNVWLLLEDRGRDYPLVFAELSEVDRADRASDRCTCLHDGTQGSGTRRLKASIGRRATYRAALGMRRGDAYVFRTWGDGAAYHAGASRTTPLLPFPTSTTRRRSVEVRIVVLSGAHHPCSSTSY